MGECRAGFYQVGLHAGAINGKRQVPVGQLQQANGRRGHAGKQQRQPPEGAAQVLFQGGHMPGDHLGIKSDPCRRLLVLGFFPGMKGAGNALVRIFTGDHLQAGGLHQPEPEGGGAPIEAQKLLCHK